MKTFITLAFVLLSACRLAAQIEGPFTSNLCFNSSFSGSHQSWADESYVEKSDDEYATFGNISGGIGSYTDYLFVTQFGFNVPEGAIIKGIKVDIERSDPNQATADYSIRLIKEGIITGTDKSTGLAYPVSDGIQTFGGANDLWGETWGFKNINGGNFGVAVAAQRNTASGTTAGQIDNIHITVYYGFVTLPLTLTSFTARKENEKVVLNWHTAAESGMNHFEVERSADGRSFYTLGLVPCQNQPAASYTFTDPDPVAGNSFYRLKMLEISGDHIHSRIVSVHYPAKPALRLNPSVHTNGTPLYVANPLHEVLTILFFDGAGQLVGKSKTSNQQVPMPVFPGKKGLVYYKVFSATNELRGSGSLLLY